MYLIKSNENIRVVLIKTLLCCAVMLNCYETQPNGETNIGFCFATKKICFICSCKILADIFCLVSMAILSYFHRQNPRYL